jgi:predicted dehydrogenase
VSAQQKIRVAVIGCGDIAETGHVPAIVAHERFELAALCDVRRERCELLAKRAGGANVRLARDYRELLDDPKIDAAILALHPEVSVDVAIDFLRRGKPVLDEKPLAATWANAVRLEQCVRQTRGGVYQVGFVLRYSRAVQALAEAARRIGTPAVYRVAIFDERLDRDNNEAHFARMQQILRNSSAITHQASHVFDFFRLLNPSRFVSAYATAVRTERDFCGPNLWSAQLTVADGSVLEVNVGWLLPAVHPSIASINGPGGYVTLDLMGGDGRCEIGGEVETIRGATLAQDWRKQLDVFAEAIDRKEATVATIDDGLRSLAASLALRSLPSELDRGAVGSK